MSETIITPDMDESLLEVRENVNVYISRNNKGFFDESTARYHGASHLKCTKCETGYAVKPRVVCDECEGVAKTDKLQEKIKTWKSLPSKEITEKCMLYCIFHDEFIDGSDDSILDFCDDNEIELSDLKLVFADKKHLSIGLYYFEDDVHEDHDFSKEFKDKLEEFNNFLSSYDTNTYEIPNLSTAFKYTVDHLSLEEINE